MATGAIPALLVATTLLGAPGQPAQGGAHLPFEELGVALLAEADARGAAKRPAVSADDVAAVLERLEVLHHRLDLGAIELWTPVVVLEPGGSLGKAFDPRGAQRWALELIELQRRWLGHLDLADEAMAERQAALDRIAEWAGGDLREEGEEEGLTAARGLMLRTFRNDLVPRPPTFVIAPTRTHMVGLFGAAGIVNPEDRGRLWNEGLRGNAFAWLGYEVLAIPLEAGPDVGSTTLVASRLEADLVLETIVHRGSHVLSERTVPLAPEWLREGLALFDTIELVGDDDSLCTGFSQRERLLIGLAYHEWVDANQSPFREGAASRWFEEELRPDGKGLFVIYDINRGKPGAHVAGPFFGPRREIPAEVLAGGDGLRRGYAEFHRAYCATFVRWLSQQRVGDHEVLTWLIQFVGDPQRQKVVSVEDLVPVGLRMITMKTLGESDDPERDVEAAFIRWLAER
jgi:hypothetical protein